MRALLVVRRHQMRSFNGNPEHLLGTQRRERFLSSEAAPRGFFKQNLGFQHS